MGSSADATLAYGIQLYDVEHEEEFVSKFFGGEISGYDGIYEVIERVDIPDGVSIDLYGYYPDSYTGGVLIINESKSWAYDYGIKKINGDLVHGVDWNAKLLEAYQALKQAAVGDLDLDEPAWLLYASYG